MVALLAGEEAEWRTLHGRYSGTMLRAIQRVRSRFPGLIGAEDVVDIYAGLCVELLNDDKRKLRSFDPSRGRGLGVWLAMVARHATYDFLRERRRQPELPWLAEELSGGEAPVEDAPDAFRVCCAKESVRVVAALLEDLSPRDRQFVVLYYCQGLEPEETAQRLGICVGTVYSKKHKIRARIEGLLEKRSTA
jgi:RNA polymerase sigma-70 factor (ECF subfamily)